MTIAMIGQKGLPARSGGIERHVSLLASGLASRGHRVLVYGRRWYVNGAKLPEGIEQKFTAGIHTKHLDALTHSLTALLAARQEHPDIIHLHGTGIALLTPIARLLHPRAKVVVTFHCIDRRLSKWNRFAKSMFHLGEWLACHFAHRTITVSQTLTRYCVETYGCQVTYIPHPFVLPDTIPSDEALRAHDLAVEHYLLFVGRLIPDKQAHQLIKGYGLARQRRPDLFSSLPLVMVGGGSWTDRYVQWLYQLGASFPGVRMLGERCGTELQSLQAHALGHVFPTASEGLSIAILEAGAFRRPVLCTHLSENDEATGGHSIAMDSQDIEDICRGLIELASLTLKQRKSMGEELHLHVKETFDAKSQIAATIDTYRELLAGDLLTVPAVA